MASDSPAAASYMLRLALQISTYPNPRLVLQQGSLPGTALKKQLGGSSTLAGVWSNRSFVCAPVYLQRSHSKSSSPLAPHDRNQTIYIQHLLTPEMRVTWHPQAARALALQE